MTIQTQASLPEPVPVKRKAPRKFKQSVTLNFLEELFGGYGYNIEQSRSSTTSSFRLTSQTEPERWGWVINPADDSMVRRPRDLTIDEWRDVARYNVRRLKLTKIAP